VLFKRARLFLLDTVVFKLFECFDGFVAQPGFTVDVGVLGSYPTHEPITWHSKIIGDIDDVLYVGQPCAFFPIHKNHPVDMECIRKFRLCLPTLVAKFGDALAKCADCHDFVTFRHHALLCR